MVVPRPRPPAPEPYRIPRSEPGPGSDNRSFEPDSIDGSTPEQRLPASDLGSRMPAQQAGAAEPAAGVGTTAAEPAAGGGAGGGFHDLGEGGGGGGPDDSFGDFGKDTLCNEPRVPYTYGENSTVMTKAWHKICKDDGYIRASACTISYYAKSAKADRGDCASALDDFRDSVKEEEQAKSRLKELNEDIVALGKRIGDLRRERAEDGDMESDKCGGRCHPGGSNAGGGSSFWKSFLPLAGGLIAGAGLGYLGYSGANAANKRASELGWAPTMNPGLSAASAAYPFVNAGIYGSIASGQQSAFGCGGTIGGGGPFSPYGMQGGAFGYPGSMYGNPLGGGMFMPGAGAGPWGNAGFPGMGLAGGFAIPGLAGGFATQGLAGGLAGYAGIAGGYAIPGLAGGYATGLAGGFATQGLAGIAGGLAGYAGIAGGYAISGLAGGFATQGLAGIAGGLAGYAGIAGGLAGYAGLAGFPGLAGGYASGGLAGGYAGGLAGYAGGLAGYAGGLAGYAGGLAGYAGGLAGYAGGLAGDPYRQSLDNSIAAQRIQMNLSNETSGLVNRINLFNSGYSNNPLGLSYGGTLGGYSGINSYNGLSGGSLLNSNIGTGPTLNGTGVLGQTR